VGCQSNLYLYLISYNIRSANYQVTVQLDVYIIDKHGCKREWLKYGKPEGHWKNGKD